MWTCSPWSAKIIWLLAFYNAAKGNLQLIIIINKPWWYVKHYAIYSIYSTHTYNIYVLCMLYKPQKIIGTHPKCHSHKAMKCRVGIASVSPLYPSSTNVRNHCGPHDQALFFLFWKHHQCSSVETDWRYWRLALKASDNGKAERMAKLMITIITINIWLIFYNLQSILSILLHMVLKKIFNMIFKKIK